MAENAAHAAPQTASDGETDGPVFRYLDASSAHLAQRERETLNAAPPRVIDHEYGWWVHIPTEPEDWDRDDWADYPTLLAVLRFGLERKCNWANIDQDADTIAGLPTYQE